jgi:predicted SnoaL-like aldol condensation-catalyzing enzyme
VVAFFVQMVQLHPEDDYVVVVEVEAVDLVITTMKAQAQAQDLVTPKKPSN